MKHFMFILLALTRVHHLSNKGSVLWKTETSSVVEETKASGNAIVIDTTKSNDFTYTITQIEVLPGMCPNVRNAIAFRKRCN